MGVTDPLILINLIRIWKEETIEIEPIMKAEYIFNTFPLNSALNIKQLRFQSTIFTCSNTFNTKILINLTHA